MINAFVTGIGGQLGHDVMNELAKRGYKAVGSDILDSVDSKFPYVQLDITDSIAVYNAISEIDPDAVIHCAAWTEVDAAEDEENIFMVRAINFNGTQNIANVCKKSDCKMIYISIFPLTMYSTVREQSRGLPIAKIMHRSVFTASQSLTASMLLQILLINILL